LQHVGDDRANVYGRVQGTGPGPRLLLNGHLDTKPGDGMTIDPFGGDIREGRLYGRGSCDMKGPVAAEMIALKAIARSGIDLHGGHRVDPIWGRSPINAMIISGGGKISASVPDECVVRFDIRMNPDLTASELDETLDATLVRLRQADPELKLEVEKVITAND